MKQTTDVNLTERLELSGFGGKITVSPERLAELARLDKADDPEGQILKARLEDEALTSDNKLVSEQAPPAPSESPAVWSLVMRDMVDRDIAGAQKYGVRLQAGNGRDALVDAYQEALDLVVYLRQALYERDRK